MWGLVALMKKAMTRKVSETSLEEKENNGGWASNILWEQESAEFEELIKKNNDNEQEIITDISSRECNLVEKYIQHCHEDGVPDEIIELMQQQGMTLMHCMQIKFGYEDGLEFKDIRQYAYPTYDKQQCINIRYQLLKEKEVLLVRGTGRCPKCKKTYAMKEISKTLVGIRDSTEHVNKSYYDPQTKMKEYYTDIVDATLLKYDVVEECQYCGYRRHNVYSEKATKM